MAIDKKKPVLILEMPDAAQRIAQELQALGYAAADIRIAQTAEEAIGMLAREEHGLVIGAWHKATSCNTDPFMEGFSLARLMRDETHPAQPLPFVMITNHDVLQEPTCMDKAKTYEEKFQVGASIRLSDIHEQISRDRLEEAITKAGEWLETPATASVKPYRPELVKTDVPLRVVRTAAL